MKGDFKIFFATDLHGSTTCFKKFIAAKQFYNVDYLILGGDLSGKRIVFIKNLGDGNYYILGENNYHPRNSEEILLFKQECEKIGVYYHEIDTLFNEKKISDTNFVQTIAKKKAAERFKEWIKYAEIKLNVKDKILAIAGNDDDNKFDSIMKGSKNFELIDSKLFNCDNRFFIAGYSYSTRTPWNTPREKSEKDIANDLKKIPSPTQNLPFIVNFHIPPKGIGLDSATALDEEFRPVIKSSGIEKINVGSDAVYNYIKERSPELGLFGHVHEGRGVSKLQNTTCINPGSIFYEGKLQGCICTFTNCKLSSWQLTEG